MSSLAIVLLAVGLILVIEGLAYGLFPGGVQKMMRLALEQPESQLRNMGLVLALVGAGIIYLVI